MMNTTATVDDLVIAALAEQTGVAAETIEATTDLGDLGVDSLALVEMLVALRDELDPDPDGGAAEDDVMPWLETVGDVVEFARTFAAEERSSC